MASTTLTNIPPTQPSCGDISLQHPSPHCPNDNSTISNNDPMGCFIQKNGLFCAPISTTRGFLYTLEPSPHFKSNNTNNSTTGMLSPHIILALSVATNDNNTNPSPPLLGVDGQPINYQSPVRLGQTCIGAQLPPPTDPLFQTLVSVANIQLNISTGYSPSFGAGTNIFNLIGDCEQGSYCDLTTPGGGVGTCKEQLPNSHNCTSFMQCISFRCNEMLDTSKSTTIKGKRATMDIYDTIRANITTLGQTICLPSKINRGGEGVGVDPGLGGDEGPNGNVGTGGSHSFGFPPWMGVIIAVVAVLGAALIFGLARRRQRLRHKKTLNPTSSVDKRYRIRSMPLQLNTPDKKIGSHRETEAYKRDNYVSTFGNLFNFSKAKAEIHEKIDSVSASSDIKDADGYSANDVSFISTGSESNYDNNQLLQESSINIPNNSNTQSEFHSHPNIYEPSECGMFEEGEPRYPESVASITNEKALSEVSSICDTSISDTSSAFPRVSSQPFRSPPPHTTSNLLLGTPVSPVSPVSPISPRFPLSSSTSSRLSHRQSTQTRNS